MAHYQVTISMIVEANEHKDAAMRAYSVIHHVTPDTFEVKDSDAASQRVSLSEEDQDEALRRTLHSAKR